MRQRLTRLSQSVAAGVFLLLVSTSGSADEPARFELEYTADAPCPDRRAFEQLLHAQLAESGDASAIVKARVIVRFRRSAAARMVARFDLVRQDGSRSSRELESASCDEAATALAFVLALALSGRDFPAEADTNASPPPAAAPIVAVPPPSAAAPRHSGSASDRERVRDAWRWRFGIGVQLGARSGVGPRFTPVEAAVVALRANHPGPWDLSLRLAFLRGQPIAHSAAAGDSTFEWLAGRVEGCFWSAALAPSLTATPCASTHVGQLTAVGAPTPLPGARGRRAAGLWLEAGGGLRFELELVKFLSLELQGEALVPLIRYRFAFDRPDTGVYRVPPLAAYALLGLVAHFP